MYADLEEEKMKGAGKLRNAKKLNINSRLSGSKLSVKESSFQAVSGGKRERGEDKWVHDLYSEQSNANTGDLRNKLIKGKGAAGKQLRVGVKDLREKLSKNSSSRQVAEVAPASKTRRLIVSVSGGDSQVVKKPQPAATRAANKNTVAGFLSGLGLSKYLAQFQVEEVDMAALRQLKEEDLKEMGIPMGPRKKIIAALAE